MRMSNKGRTFTVSARRKPNSVEMSLWLSQFSQVVQEGTISSVFGFSTFSPLYGGRGFSMPEVTDKDIDYLSKENIGFRIPLSTSFFNEKDYGKTKSLLDKHHHERNSIICTNDELAKRIRQDYPKYTIEASAIKNIKAKDVERHLDVYDSVVLPMDANDNLKALNKIKSKDRVILFANAGCAYNCPSKICYPVISKINDKTVEVDNVTTCSKQLKPREDLGMVFFDLEKLTALGFTKFKLLPIYDRN